MMAECRSSHRECMEEFIEIYKDLAKFPAFGRCMAILHYAAGFFHKCTHLIDLSVASISWRGFSQLHVKKAKMEFSRFELKLLQLHGLKDWLQENTQYVMTEKHMCNAETVPNFCPCISIALNTTPFPLITNYSKDLCSHLNVQAQGHVTNAQDTSWCMRRRCCRVAGYLYLAITAQCVLVLIKALTVVSAGVLAVFHKVGQYLGELLLAHIHLDGFNGLEQLVPCKIVGKFCQELGPMDKIELQQCILPSEVSCELSVSTTEAKTENNLPSAVLKRNSSPSLRKISQTRQAKSKGMAFANTVYIQSNKYKSALRQDSLNIPDRNSKPGLLLIDSLVYCKYNALDYKVRECAGNVKLDEFHARLLIRVISRLREHAVWSVYTAAVFCCPQSLLSPGILPVRCLSSSSWDLAGKLEGRLCRMRAELLATTSSYFLLPLPDDRILAGESGMPRPTCWQQIMDHYCFAKWSSFK
uniref:Uncharacterized protein n=1 Tax=Timema tahoe TaxID=61484 RepID=A0A7R9FH51_9NEOP|nr:unnamed protein product [Timema tahoe]